MSHAGAWYRAPPPPAATSYSASTYGHAPAAPQPVAAPVVTKAATYNKTFASQWSLAPQPGQASHTTSRRPHQVPYQSQPGYRPQDKLARERLRFHEPTDRIRLGRGVTSSTALQRSDGAATALVHDASRHPAASPIQRPRTAQTAKLQASTQAQDALVWREPAERQPAPSPVRKVQVAAMQKSQGVAEVLGVAPPQSYKPQRAQFPRANGNQSGRVAACLTRDAAAAEAAAARVPDHLPRSPASSSPRRTQHVQRMLNSQSRPFGAPEPLRDGRPRGVKRVPPSGGIDHYGSQIDFTMGPPRI